MIGNFPYLVVGILFVMGFVGLIFERNLVKIAIAVSVVEAATNLFIITLGYRFGGKHTRLDDGGKRIRQDGPAHPASADAHCDRHRSCNDGTDAFLRHDDLPPLRFP